MAAAGLFKSVIVATAFAVAGAAPILAADETSPTSSYADVVAKGFEVKDVTLVTGPAADRMTGTKDSDPQAMVTLQRGDKTAVCFFNALNWMNRAPASMTKADRCSVY